MVHWLRGERAKVLVDAIVERLQPYLPPSIRTVRTSVTVNGGWLQVWAVLAADPPEADGSFMRAERSADNVSISARGVICPPGIGVFPVWPPRLAATRLTAVALALVTEQIAAAIGSNWPSAGTMRKISYQREGIVVRFSDKVGRRLFVLPLFQLKLFKK